MKHQQGQQQRNPEDSKPYTPADAAADKAAKEAADRAANPKPQPPPKEKPLDQYTLDDVLLALIEPALDPVRRLLLANRLTILTTSEVAKGRTEAENAAVDAASKAWETINWDLFFAGQVSRQPPKPVGRTPDGREVYMNLTIRRPYGQAKK